MYDKLRDLLAAGKWKDANEETWEIPSSENDRVLVLNTIDSLWGEYSKGHFGFSTQKRIWEKADQEWESKREKIFKICESQTDREYPSADNLWEDKKGKLIYETFVQHIGWAKTGIGFRVYVGGIKIVNYQERVDFIINHQGDISSYYNHMRDDSEIIFSLDAPEGHLPYYSSFNLKNVEDGYLNIGITIGKISSFYSVFKNI